MIAARAASGPTGERLLELLESRLDNVVFRTSFARTIPAARQLINHGHITVNGRRVDIPSFQVKPQQVVSVRLRSKHLPFVAASLQSGRGFDTSWLSVNPAERSATIVTPPDAASVPFTVALQLVVEFYSQRV
jgi:small subunit ribosomal protein S4